MLPLNWVIVVVIFDRNYKNNKNLSKQGQFSRIQAYKYARSPTHNSSPSSKHRACQSNFPEILQFMHLGHVFHKLFDHIINCSSSFFRKNNELTRTIQRSVVKLCVKVISKKNLYLEE